MQSRSTRKEPDSKNGKSSHNDDNRPEVLTKKASGGSVSRHKLSVNKILESQQQMKALEESNGKLHITNTGVIEIDKVLDDDQRKFSNATNQNQNSPSNKYRFGNSKYLMTTDEESPSQIEFSVPEGQHKHPEPPQKRSNDSRNLDDLDTSTPEPEPKKTKSKLPKPPPDFHAHANQRSRQLKYASSISTDTITTSDEQNQKNQNKTNWNQQAAESIRKESNAKQNDSPVNVEENRQSNVSNKPSKVITKPNVRKRTLSRNNSANFSTNSPNNAPDRKSTLISASSSNQSMPSLTSEDAPLREPTKPLRNRSRRSPIKSKKSPSKLPQQELNDDEKPVVDDSDSDELEKTKSSTKRNLYFFSEASDENRQQRLKSNRPAPLMTSFPSRNKATRDINQALDERNEAIGIEKFVLSNEDCLTKNGKGKEYIPPNWDIKCVKIPAPNDAKYIHVKQSTYSMSSIMNGVKRT